MPKYKSKTTYSREINPKTGEVGQLKGRISYSPIERSKKTPFKIAFIVMLIFMLNLAVVSYEVVDNDAYELVQVGSNDTLLNLPINDLNGLSLNEVFEVYQVPYTQSNLNKINNGWFVNDNDTLNYFDTVVNYSPISADHKIYTVYDYGYNMYEYDTQVDRLFIQASNGRYYNDKTYNNGVILENISHIWTLNDSNETFYQFQIGIQDYAEQIQVGEKFYFDMKVFIDITALGIDLTVEQMDYYYSQYKQLADTNQVIEVYRDNWTQQEKQTLGNAVMYYPKTLINELSTYTDTITTITDGIKNMLDSVSPILDKLDFIGDTIEGTLNVMKRIRDFLNPFN